MALKIQRYDNNQLFHQYDSIYGRNDTLGEVVDEIMVQVNQPIFLDQIEVAQSNGDSEVVWRAGAYQLRFEATSSLRVVLPTLNTQSILGIIRVFYSPPANPLQHEECCIGEMQPKLIGDFTEEQNDFIKRSKGHMGLDLDRDQMLSAVKILYPHADKKHLDEFTTEQLETNLRKAVQKENAPVVPFMGLPPDIRMSILAMFDNKTIHKICGSNREVRDWCSRSKVFDEVFKRKYGHAAYHAFIGRHPDNELNNGMWRLRSYEYVRVIQLFDNVIYIEKSGFKASLKKLKSEKWDGDDIRLYFNPIYTLEQAVGQAQVNFHRLNKNMMDLARDSYLRVDTRESERLNNAQIWGIFVGTITQMERFMFKLFEWGVVLKDNLSVHDGGKDMWRRKKASLPINQQCKMCEEEAKFQCKRCKSARYCSNECKEIGWKQGHKDECISQSNQLMPVGRSLEDLPAELVTIVASMRSMTVQDIEAFSKTLGTSAQAHAKGLFASNFWVFIQQPNFWQAIARDRHTEEEFVPFWTLSTANTPNWTPDWKWVSIALEVEKEYAVNGRYAVFTRPAHVFGKEGSEEEERTVSMTQSSQPVDMLDPKNWFIFNFADDFNAHFAVGVGSLEEVAGRTLARSAGLNIYWNTVEGMFGEQVPDARTWERMRMWVRLFIYKLLREGYYWQDNRGRKISSEMLVGQSTCPPQPMPGVISKRKMTFGKELGKGAFGVVRAGTYMGKPVAIKTIQGTPTPAAIKDFSEEARLLGNIRPHPNVVQFIGITQNPLMLVTELVTGGGLDSRLKPGKPPVQWSDIMRWAQGIVAGIQYLHSNRVLHRDLAARNVLLDGRGNAKVTDFGLSRRICVQDKELRFQQQEFFRGPYKWMPPESLARNQFSVKSDVWAYGVTLWEIMTRRLPFEFIPDINVVKQWVLNKRMRLPLPSRWPKEMSNILAACWRTKPKDRPSTRRLLSWLGNAQKHSRSRKGPYSQLPAVSDNEIRTLYK